jgi:glucuronoarabinoxylan endo-1,4-beta-xylanase
MGPSKTRVSLEPEVGVCRATLMATGVVVFLGGACEQGQSGAGSDFRGTLPSTGGDPASGGTRGDPVAEPTGGATPVGTGGALTGTGGAAPTGPADSIVTLDPTRRHQTLVGFGAAVAYYSNYLSVRRDDIYRVLFKDLGLDLLRIGNWYQNQSSSGTTVSTAFTDDAIVTIVQQATATLGYPPKILMSSWSPPSYLKSNGTTQGSRGTLVGSAGVFQYEQFADWWVRSLEAYAARGVVPEYISLQNEPDYFDAGWETCQFDPTEGTNAGYGRALDAVYRAVQASSLAVKPAFIGPETTGINNNVVGRYLNGMNLDQIAAVAHHLYNGGEGGSDPEPESFATAMGAVSTQATNAGKLVFMTEFAATAPTWFNTARLIQYSLTSEGVSAYVYWDLIWAPPASGTSPTGLVTIQSALASSPYAVNDLYYAVKHFAKWTDPGWTRVSATASLGTLRVSAFLSPEGTSLTTIVLNTDTAEHVIELDPGGFAFQTSTAYRSSGSSERTTPLALAEGTRVALPPQSIVTVTLGP